MILKLLGYNSEKIPEIHKRDDCFQNLFVKNICTLIETVADHGSRVTALILSVLGYSRNVPLERVKRKLQPSLAAELLS